MATLLASVPVDGLLGSSQVDTAVPERPFPEAAAALNSYLSLVRPLFPRIDGILICKNSVNETALRQQAVVTIYVRLAGTGACPSERATRLHE
jgi:hypothetical protein